MIEAVQTRRLRLAPATAEELEEREAERIDQEQLRLRNKPSHELKAEAAQSMVDARRQAQVQEADRLLEAKEEHDKLVGGYPPLPDFFKGRRVDRDFFHKVGRCTREEWKFLTQKYGQANIEARIRGIR